MADSPSLSPLEAAIAAIIQTLEATGTRGMVIGGVAASLLGRPRTTRDVDAVVWLPEVRTWKRFLSAAKRHGLRPRIADPLGFAMQSRVLLLRHASSGIDVDVSLAALPFEEEAIANAALHDLGRLRIPLPRPEDLIVMKAIAHRPRDAADIEALVDAHDALDVDRIRRVVNEFASALAAPEIFADLERLLKRPKASTRRSGAPSVVAPKKARSPRRASSPKRRLAAKKRR